MSKTFKHKMYYYLLTGYLENVHSTCIVMGAYVVPAYIIIKINRFA